MNRRSHHFVWGANFFLQIPPNLTRLAQKCPKNWPLLWLRVCIPCPGGALTHFPCKLRLIFFTSLRLPGGAGAPIAPPGYAYGIMHYTVLVNRLRNMLYVQSLWPVCL